MVFPEFLKPIEKYNAVVRKTKTIDKFLKLVTKIADDPIITADQVMTLVRHLERDLKMVHNSVEFGEFVEIIQALVDFMKMEEKRKSVKSQKNTAKSGAFLPACKGGGKGQNNTAKSGAVLPACKGGKGAKLL